MNGESTPWGNSTYLAIGQQQAQQVAGTADWWKIDSRDIYSPAFYLEKFQKPGSLPFKQFWNGSAFNHFYTSSQSDISYVLNNGSIENEVKGYIYPSPKAGLLPLYRLHKIHGTTTAGALDIQHYYATNPMHAKTLTNAYYKYAYDGIVGYVCP